MADVTDSLLASLKKLPGQIVGGPVDLANLIAGGYKNIVDTVVGNPVVDSTFTPKPVGGSEWINEKFGLGGPSSGLVEDSTSAILGVLANPSLLATKVAAVAPKAAMVIAAHLTKSPEEMLAATRALRKGENAAAVFYDTGMYRGPLDNKLRTVISDADSKLNPDVLASYAPDRKYVPRDPTTGEGTGASLKSNNLEKPLTLKDVLDHPELYKAYPELADLTIRDNPYVGYGGASFSRGGTYSDGTTTYPPSINTGLFADPQQLHSAILHEVQHYIQYQEGFMGGGNVKLFRTPEELEQISAADKTFRNVAQQAKNILVDRHKMEPWQVQQVAFEIETGSKPYVGNTMPDSFWKDEDWLNYMSARKGQSLVAAKRDEDHKKYLSIAGETEARATQKAFNLVSKPALSSELTSAGAHSFSADSQGVFYPLSLYDISPSELIPAPGQEYLVTKPTKP